VATGIGLSNIEEFSQNPPEARDAGRCALAELIRQHRIQNFVEPARKNGKAQIEIRAGDVHAALGFANRLPAVTAALGAEKFERTARVVRLGIKEPGNEANTTFTFRLL
jgi:hypothetical protein